MMKQGTPESRKIVAMLAREYRLCKRAYRIFGGDRNMFKRGMASVLYKQAKELL